MVRLSVLISGGNFGGEGLGSWGVDWVVEEEEEEEQEEQEEQYDMVDVI